MIDRHRRLSGDHSREHHDAVTGREDGLAALPPRSTRDDPAASSRPVCRKRVPRAAAERAASRIACLLTPCLRRHSRRSRRRPRLVELRATSSFLDLAWSSARFNADQTGNPQGSRRSTTAGSVCCFRGGYGIGDEDVHLSSGLCSHSPTSRARARFPASAGPGSHETGPTAVRVPGQGSPDRLHQPD